MRLVVLFIITISLSIALNAQAPKRVEVATIPVNPADVASIDSIVKAFYDTISGPVGQPRQWGRDKTLYVPGVQFVSLSERNGKISMSVSDHQKYVDSSNDSFVSQGFFEKEVHRVGKRFGNIAHVFSTYEFRSKLDGPVLGRGINSLELAFDGTRWWIASAIWDDERPNNPIPAEFLPPKK
ncbi:MAG: hypothetical protein ABIR33_00550 [Pyrinomonadaceae bacterium]